MAAAQPAKVLLIEPVPRGAPIGTTISARRIRMPVLHDTRVIELTKVCARNIIPESHDFRHSAIIGDYTPERRWSMMLTTDVPNMGIEENEYYMVAMIEAMIIANYDQAH